MFFQSWPLASVKKIRRKQAGHVYGCVNLQIALISRVQSGGFIAPQLQKINGIKRLFSAEPKSSMHKEQGNYVARYFFFAHQAGPNYFPSYTSVADQYYSEYTDN